MENHRQTLSIQSIPVHHPTEHTNKISTMKIDKKRTESILNSCWFVITQYRTLLPQK